MTEDELLGSDNQARLKQLAGEDAPTITTSITTNLTSPDSPIRRDAALAIVFLARTLQKHSSASCAADTVSFISALCSSLSSSSSSSSSPPGTSKNKDDDALAVEASLAALYCCLLSLRAAKVGMDEKDKEEEDSLLPLLLPIIIFYADGHQRFGTSTTAPATFTAQRLLENLYLMHDNDDDEARQGFIVQRVLRRYLRPIFSKTTTTSSSITAEGRPVLFRAHPASPQGGGFDAQKTAWKNVFGGGLDVITVFAWAVSASKSATIEKHWPLYIPVLITLVEDDDLATRQRGLEILDVFLAKCPADTLRSSGVDALFQEAVFPSLLFLPTLTPEAESVALLRIAYRALLTMARAGHGATTTARKRSRGLLDKMLRDGVLTGYFHASQHIRVVEVLMLSAAQIVEALECHAVKHLQNLLDLYDSVLTDPFALAYTPAVLAAAKALNATVLNCWPRITGMPHAENIIQMVARSWTIVDESAGAKESAELRSLREELSQTMSYLAALWKDNNNARVPTEKLAQVVSKAPHLKSLLEPLIQLETPAAR